MGDEQLVERILEDWRTAPVSERVRAMLRFLEQLTLQPGSVTAADADALRAAGLSDTAIEEAIHVTALFSIYDRLADALDFDVPGPEAFAYSAKVLLRRGYL